MSKLQIKKIFILGSLFLLGIYFFSSTSFAQYWDPNAGKCADSSFDQNSCKNKKTSSCSNSTCQLTPNAQGQLPNDCPNANIKRYDVDVNCVANLNAQAGSCLDTMPVESVQRVAETNCYRNEGWSKKRNHLGTDYAATTGTIITAAADGKVFWAKELNGGGRVVMIEHQKQCQCGANSPNSGCDDKFITVYMHLSAYNVSEGASVKKGDTIGLVGGSNYKDGKLYDYPPSPPAYGPHLHFEIHSGDAKKGYNTLKKSIIDPLCDEIQSFCGGCPSSYNVKEECLNKTNTNQWTEMDECAKQNKQAAKPPANLRTESDTTGSKPGSPNPDGGNTPNSYPKASGRCDLNNFLFQGDTCLFCPLFKTLFNTASKMAAKSYKALADGIANVVIIMFAIWISWYVLRHVSAIEVQKTSKMIQGLLVQAFRVLIVVLILKASYGEVLKLTLDPIFNTGMKYVQTISDSAGCPSGASYMQGIAGYTDSAEAGGLPKSMGENIICSIKTMQDSVAKMISYGRQARCIGWHNQAIVEWFIPSFPYVLTGWLLMLGGAILLLAFPWCLIDCVLNMAIAAALLPAAVGAWAFKITASYLNKIWDFFMNAMFQFVFLSIILYLIMKTVDKVMQGLNKGAENDWSVFTDPINGLAWWGVNGAKLFVVCVLGWVFLDQAKDIADHFAKAPSLGIGKTTGGLFAQAATRAALGKKDKNGKRHGGLVGAGKGIAKTGKSAANHFIAQPVKRAVNKKQIENVKKNGTAVKDADGNVIGYEMKKKNLFGKESLRVVDIDASGKERLANVVKNNDGSTTKIIKDHLLTVVEKRDSNGNIILQNAEFTAEAVKYLVLPNGKINTEMVAQLKNGTRHNQQMMDKAIAQEVLKRRGISVSNIKDAKIEQDGTIVFQQTDSKGTVRTMTARMEDDQMITTYHSVDINGNERYIQDNGILKDTVTKKAGGPAIAHTTLNQYYIEHTNYHQAMDKHGNFNPMINEQAAMRGRSYEDKMRHLAQIRTKEDQAYSVYIDHNETFISIKTPNKDGSTTEASEDRVLTFKRTIDKNNNILEIVELNTDSTENLIYQDGRINAKKEAELKMATRFDESRVNIAVLQEVLKQRGLGMVNAGSYIRQNDGTFVFEQTDTNGQKRIITAKWDGNQMITTEQLVDTQGNERFIKDNGIQRMEIFKESGKDAVAHFSWNNYYTEQSSNRMVMNERGELNNIVNETDAMRGFSSEEKNLHMAQIQTGKDQIIKTT